MAARGPLRDPLGGLSGVGAEAVAGGNGDVLRGPVRQGGERHRRVDPEECRGRPAPGAAQHDLSIVEQSKGVGLLAVDLEGGARSGPHRGVVHGRVELDLVVGSRDHRSGGGGDRVVEEHRRPVVEHGGVVVQPDGEGGRHVPGGPHGVVELGSHQIAVVAVQGVELHPGARGGEVPDVILDAQRLAVRVVNGNVLDQVTLPRGRRGPTRA